MIQFHLHNIQSIENATFKFDGPGVVEFQGNNSNGKSILTKVLMALLNGDYLNKRKRRTLIRRGAEEGSIAIVRDKQCVSIYLRQEVKDCFYIWIPNTDQMEKCIKRYVKEGGLPEYLDAIGFKAYPEEGICLQVAPTRGAVPFVTTSYSTNSKIVKSILEDRSATLFIKNYHEVTYPLIQQQVASLHAEKKRIEFGLSQIPTYDVAPYQEVLKIISSVLPYGAIPYIDKPLSLPVAEVVNLEPLSYKVQPLFSVQEEPPVLDTLVSMFTQGLDEWKSISEGVCPTCGKRLIE